MLKQTFLIFLLGIGLTVGGCIAFGNKPSVDEPYTVGKGGALDGKIAFVNGRWGVRDERRIWIMLPDGSKRHPLTQDSEFSGENRPSWSFDGRQLAFSAIRHSHASSVYIRDMDAANQFCITADLGECDSPTWSPDGSHIAFAMWEDNRENAHIFIIKKDGTELRQLTDGPGYNWMPKWSPTGKTILFESTRDGDREIYTMNTDGSDQVNLTQHPGVDRAGVDHAPCWSPGGKRIAFMSRRDSGNADIYVMNGDGSSVVRLTHDPARDSEPCWSPDGDWIAFTRSGDAAGDAMDIWIMKADGTSQRNLTQNPNHIQSWGPAWAP